MSSPNSLGHFQLLEKLSKGGMGVVWKARDSHLDRFVAIEVLRLEMVADLERRRRFILEVKAASALNHPNIVTVHDIAEANGELYIVIKHSRAILSTGQSELLTTASRTRLLRKKPELRAQSMADARVVLREFRDDEPGETLTPKTAAPRMGRPDQLSILFGYPKRAGSDIMLVDGIR